MYATAVATFLLGGMACTDPRVGETLFPEEKSVQDYNTPKAYMLTPNGKPINIKVQTYLLTGKTVFSADNGRVKIPVQLTQAVTKDYTATVIAKTDIAPYKDGNTEVKPLSADAYEFIRSSATVKAGQTRSNDSIELQCTNLTKLDSGYYYMILQLTNEEDGVKLSSSHKEVKVVVAVTQDKYSGLWLKKDSEEGLTQISNAQLGLSATTPFRTGEWNALTDNDPSTIVEMDLQKVYQIDGLEGAFSGIAMAAGIQLRDGNPYLTGTPPGIVEISYLDKDGVEHPLGRHTFNTPIFAPLDWQVVAMEKSVPATSIRIKVISEDIRGFFPKQGYVAVGGIKLYR